MGSRNNRARNFLYPILCLVIILCTVVATTGEISKNTVESATTSSSNGNPQTTTTETATNNVPVANVNAKFPPDSTSSSASSSAVKTEPVAQTAASTGASAKIGQKGEDTSLSFKTQIEPQREAVAPATLAPTTAPDSSELKTETKSEAVGASTDGSEKTQQQQQEKSTEEATKSATTTSDTTSTSSQKEPKSAEGTNLFVSISKEKEVSESQIEKEHIIEKDAPRLVTTINVQLSNGRSFPRVGIGAGNLPRSQIPFIIYKGLYSCRLIDTARHFSNESLVARAILRWLKKQPKVTEFDELQHVIHVMIKIPYTHLGYERTSLSIRESLNDLSSILYTAAPQGFQVKVHAILQWPRCYEEIDWMRCRDAEEELDEHTRSVGPDPTLDAENAWKESWRAMEENYMAGLLESIGVSNFDKDDMTVLLDLATVKPHFFQGNLKNMLYDIELMRMLKRENIFFQVYNVMKDTVGKSHRAPRAYAILHRIGLNYAKDDESGAGGFSGPRILLSWLIENGYGVIPGASSEHHLIDNLPEHILQVPKLADRHNTDVLTALGSLVQGVELSEYHFSGNDASKGVVVSFYNAFERPVKIFAVKNGRQIPCSGWMDKGKHNRLVASPQDVFVAYDGHGTAVKRFRISKDHGMEETLTVEV